MNYDDELRQSPVAIGQDVDFVKFKVAKSGRWKEEWKSEKFRHLSITSPYVLNKTQFVRTYGEFAYVLADAAQHAFVFVFCAIVL